MKLLIYLIFITLYLLVTFFGLGPVFLADGSNQERLITFAIVVVIYLSLTIIFRFIIKKINR